MDLPLYNPPKSKCLDPPLSLRLAPIREVTDVTENVLASMADPQRKGFECWAGLYRGLQVGCQVAKCKFKVMIAK